MKITRFTTTPLTLGKSLLRIETDAGVEGWAEVPGRNNRVFDGYLEGLIAPGRPGGSMETACTRAGRPSRRG